jgi:hypothetical protein
MILVGAFYTGVLLAELIVSPPVTHARTTAYLMVNAGVFLIGLGLALWSQQSGSAPHEKDETAVHEESM